MGMGKSTAAKFLRGRGFALIDTDDISRVVVAPGQPALAEIVARFGPGVVDDQGRLRREILAARVFSDPALLRDLEAILHPRIRDRWVSESVEWRARGEPLGVVVIPLLFETESSREFDATVCVACSDRTQWKRLIARGLSAAQIEQRLARQLPAREKMARADFVVWTDVPEQVHYDQWEEVLSRVLK